MRYSAVFLLPAALRAQGNAFAYALGLQDDPDDPSGTFSVPLSSDGVTITHWGTRFDMSDELDAMLKAEQENAGPLFQALIYEVRDDIHDLAHFNAVLAAHGLSRIAYEP